MKTNQAVVLVTGANRGLGKAIVAASLDAGARRVYASARDVTQLKQVLALAPERVVPLSLDITDAASLAAAAEQASDVSLLINNAGVLASYDVLASSTDDIARDFAVNFYGTLAATKAFLPALERAGKREGAAVVNVLSIVSLSNLPGLGGYSASKAAAYSLTQALRPSLSKANINVHAVLAGAIDTDMVRSMNMVKTSPADVARAIIEAVDQGLEDVFPDPMSKALFATFRSDPKALEQQLAGMPG
jgi:NAD(P)-dependent dehydrogenase (short-subunit alcohol dehydrogenase family)